jgi:recombination protein RecT
MDNKSVEEKSIVEYLNSDTILDNIRHTLGAKTPQFIASVASLVSATPQLKTCDRKTLLSACLIAANLDLPVNPSLGFAFVIPYKNKAQFQMGYKGFIQLAMRSGQFKTLNVSDVREGEIGNTNRLTGEIEFHWAEDGRDELPIIGFVAYMRLTNGFEKSLYMTVKELEQHAGKYSASFKYNSKTMNLWRDEFGVMASKTVIKLLLARYAPMTTEMQTAQLADQAVITDDGMEYVDNEPINPSEVAAEKEKNRLLSHIHDAKTIAELELCAESLGDATELIDEYDLKFEQLNQEVKNAKK